MNRGGRTRIGVFGAGYVGIVTAAGIAELGRSVVLYDTDAAKIAMLRAGRLPLHETGLLELVTRNVTTGRLTFADEPRAAVAGCMAVFIAVGTPADAAGRVELANVRDAARAIAAHVDGPTVIVNKSTVPVDTGDLVSGIVRDAGHVHAVTVASNPEFLREGTAVADFFQPDRIVIGCDDPDATGLLCDLYASLGAPIQLTDVRSAEMIKYAANAFLALKISYANEIAAICAGVGANATAVLAGVGSDARIGPAYLNPGLGFGGSCLPKDVAALRHAGLAAGCEALLPDAILAINRHQVDRICTRIAALVGDLGKARIAVLGLAFKPGTDDVRESPAIALAERLLAAGAEVAVHDPVAMENARTRLGSRVTYAPAGNFSAVAHDADALVLATEWDTYRHLPAALAQAMRRPLLIDARNFYHARSAAALGFQYEGAGRTA